MSIAAIKWAKGQRPRNATCRAVLMAVAEYANEDGLGWPSQKTLADDMLLSDRTIRTALAALEADGFIIRLSRRNPDGTRGVDRIQLCLTDEIRQKAEERIQRKKLPVAQPAENIAKTTGKICQNHRKMAAQPPEAVSAQEPSQDDPQEGNPHKQNRSDANASGRTALAVLPDEISPLDRLWLDGRPILIEADCTPKLAGDMIGQWLSRYRDPARILAALLAVREAGTKNPIPFVIAILDAQSGKRAGQKQGRRSAMLNIGLEEGGWLQ